MYCEQCVNRHPDRIDMDRLSYGKQGEGVEDSLPRSRLTDANFWIQVLLGITTVGLLASTIVLGVENARIRPSCNQVYLENVYVLPPLGSEGMANITKGLNYMFSEKDPNKPATFEQKDLTPEFFATDLIGQATTETKDADGNKKKRATAQSAGISSHLISYQARGKTQDNPGIIMEAMAFETAGDFDEYLKDKDDNDKAGLFNIMWNGATVSSSIVDKSKVAATLNGYAKLNPMVNMEYQQMVYVPESGNGFDCPATKATVNKNLPDKYKN